MKQIKRILLITFLFIVSLDTQGQYTSKKGYWSAELTLSEGVELPFSLFYDEQKEVFTIINDDEHITLEKLSTKGDSVVFGFVSFNSLLVFRVSGKKLISGYFHNKDRKTNAKIPFKAKYSGIKLRYKKSKIAHDITGKWKTSFSAFKKDEYPAIGVFEQNEKGRISGTFLTETGDYRYLAGSLNGNKLTLSCFDGSHAFLFTAELINSNLSGTFYSGSHWKTNWIAQRNESFELADPYALTYLKDGAEIKFSKPDTAGLVYNYPNKSTKGKVVIIQLIGTWCPNCLDETTYFKDLYKKFHQEGLEIIAIGYEAPENFEEQAKRIRTYSEKKEIPYPILVGGIASKNLAAQDFSMLNNITSFPTSILLNRQGEVVLIHTGFNGPGTGEIYTNYVNETNKLIERLLNE